MDVRNWINLIRRQVISWTGTLHNFHGSVNGFFGQVENKFDAGASGKPETTGIEGSIRDGMGTVWENFAGPGDLRIINEADFLALIIRVQRGATQTSFL